MCHAEQLMTLQPSAGRQRFEELLYPVLARGCAHAHEVRDLDLETRTSQHFHEHRLAVFPIMDGLAGCEPACFIHLWDGGEIGFSPHEVASGDEPDGVQKSARVGRGQQQVTSGFEQTPDRRQKPHRMVEDMLDDLSQDGSIELPRFDAGKGSRWFRFAS